jgi:hypothetical protein
MPFLNELSFSFRTSLMDVNLHNYFALP